MATVYYVDAIPGREEAVHEALDALEDVASSARVKDGNYDVAILVDIEGPAELVKWETNTLRRVSNAPQFKRVDDPSADILKRLDA